MFREYINIISNSSSMEELKRTIQSAMADDSLTSAQRHAIVALYKARQKEIKTDYLKKIYKDKNNKKLFWNLYSLLRHPEGDVRKRTIQIVYELNSLLTTEERDILFGIYKQEQKGDNIENVDTPEPLEPF